MNSLQCFLDMHKIRISCTNLKKLLDLYQNLDSDTDRELTALLISRTLSNYSLAYATKENNISVLLDYQNKIDDPKLIEIIKQNICGLLESVLLNNRMLIYIVKKRTNKIIETTVINDPFSFLPIITNCACNTFMKHSEFSTSVLLIIIKTPQGIGGKIIHTIVKNLEIESDPESITSFDPENMSLVTSITIIDPEVDNININININNNTIMKDTDTRCVKLETLFGIVYRAIVLHNDTFTDEYDELLSVIVNSPLMSPERIMPIIIHRVSPKYLTQFIKRISIICDESVVRRIATNVPNIYKLLFTHQFDSAKRHKSLRYRHISDDDSLDEKLSSTSYIDIFSEILKQTADFMNSTTIDNIIMTVHGIDDTQSVPVRAEPYRYSLDLNRDKINVHMKISTKQFNIEAIKIVNTYFPVQLVHIIQKLFLSSLCMFNTMKYYDDDFRRDLIIYTRQLNFWGYLPYDKLCEKHLHLTNDVKDCPLCLTETRWSFRCKHAMCRRCFIDNAYSVENMNRHKDFVFNDCVTCNTTKRMKHLVNDAARANREQMRRHNNNIDVEEEN